MEDLNNKIQATMAVITNMDNIKFTDQLVVMKLMYDLGTQMEKIAKANKIKVIPAEADEDAMKFPKMQWGIRFDNGKEQ